MITNGKYKIKVYKLDSDDVGTYGTIVVIKTMFPGDCSLAGLYVRQ